MLVMCAVVGSPGSDVADSELLAWIARVAAANDLFKLAEVCQGVNCQFFLCRDAKCSAIFSFIGALHACESCRRGSARLRSTGSIHFMHSFKAVLRSISCYRFFYHCFTELLSTSGVRGVRRSHERWCDADSEGAR